ncbi:MAG: TonB-dependent receptor [Nitrosomonas sp.]|nr:TonB-dependent receptor [Nitrosomonas sp.]
MNIALSALALCFLFVGSVLAQTTMLNIPAQSLPEALHSLSSQTGVQLLFNGTQMQDIRNQAVAGAMQPDAALNRMLEGTSYTYEKSSANTYVIKTAAGEKPVVMPEIRVTGMVDPDAPDNPDYRRTKAFSATKTDALVMETPVSVQVVPRAVMDDQKSVTLKDTLENVSGVQATPTLGNDTGFNIRGFRSGRNYRNGLLANGGNANFPTMFDTANLQSVEVLKGPASILFGRGEPGGLVHLTTKRPHATPYYSLEQQFGSYDFYRTQWDATGPVTQDGALLYRFNGSYLNTDSFRDNIFTERTMGSGSVTWRPTNATEFIVEVEGIYQEGQADFGIPVVGNRPVKIPVSRTFSDRNDPVDKKDKIHVGTEFSHQFNANWTIRNRFLMTHYDQNTTFFNPAPAFGDALRDNRFLERNIFSQRHQSELYTTNLDLDGKFDIGFTRHAVLVGFDYMRSQTRYFTRGDYENPNPALTVDIFSPVSTATDPAVIRQTLSPNSSAFGKNVFEDEWFGVYFHDRITLWDKLHILGGGRYDWTVTGRANSTVSFSEAEANVPRRKDQGFSPRVGILYQLLPQLSLFGNWTTSFGASNGLSATGATFNPQRGEQFEAGIKTALFQDRLIATASFYHIIRENLLTPDLSTLDPLDSIAIGRQRSRGVEFDISGRITEELSLIGSYAYTDANVIRDNSGLLDNRLPQAPKHAGSIWLRYDIRKIQQLNGLSFGVGVFAVGKRDGDIQNTFKLPGYARLDAFAAYRMKLGPTRLTAQVNARNILDARYFESTDPDSNVAPRLGVLPGAPVTILGSLRLEY